MSRFPPGNETVQQIKLCAAQWIYSHRLRLTPRSRQEIHRQHPNYDIVLSWQQWWEGMFGERYMPYAKRNSIGEEAARCPK